MNNEMRLKLHLQNVKQRVFGWMQYINVKYNIVKIWWRYDSRGKPHKIGWMFFDKITIRYRNVT